MEQIIFQDLDRSVIWNEIVDKRCEYNLLHQFNPNYVTEWWKTSIRLGDKLQLENVLVREMQMDLQVDLSILKQIVELDIHYLSIYQFKKPVPGTLILNDLPETSKYNILRKNELQCCIEITLDLVTVWAFEEDHINRLRSNKLIASQIVMHE